MKRKLYWGIATLIIIAITTTIYLLLLRNTDTKPIVIYKTDVEPARRTQTKLATETTATKPPAESTTAEKTITEKPDIITLDTSDIKTEEEDQDHYIYSIENIDEWIDEAYTEYLEELEDGISQSTPEVQKVIRRFLKPQTKAEFRKAMIYYGSLSQSESEADMKAHLKRKSELDQRMEKLIRRLHNE